jgi:hypothetical protein
LFRVPPGVGVTDAVFFAAVGELLFVAGVECAPENPAGVADDELKPVFVETAGVAKLVTEELGIADFFLSGVNIGIVTGTIFLGDFFAETARIVGVTIVRDDSAGVDVKAGEEIVEFRLASFGVPTTFVSVL